MKEWKWPGRGVDLNEDHLLWYDDMGSCSFAGGGASSQSFQEFLERGCPVEGVPEDVVAEITQAVKEKVAEPKRE